MIINVRDALFAQHTKGLTVGACCSSSGLIVNKLESNDIDTNDMAAIANKQEPPTQASSRQVFNNSVYTCMTCKDLQHCFVHIFTKYGRGVQGSVALMTQWPVCLCCAAAHQSKHDAEPACPAGLHQDHIRELAVLAVDYIQVGMYVACT